jgi:radical SAM protein with 4Fe4S-binding SPASM domain
MYYLNKKMVQVWKEKNLYLLVNHYWQGSKHMSKYGLRVLYQEISQKQLEALERLQGAEEEERSKLIGIVGKRLYSRLIRHKFLTDNEETDTFKPSTYSIAGLHLTSYLRKVYNIQQCSSPTKVQFIVTRRCFGNCIYCLANSSEGSKLHELSDDEWIKISNRVCDELNPCQVEIIGGEPFLRFDAVKNICKTISNNILITIFTNGSILSDIGKCRELYEILKNRRHYITISLDGDENTHDFLRPGAKYRKVMQAIKNVSEIGLNWGINLTLVKNNFEKVEHLIHDISQYNPCLYAVRALQASSKDVDLYTKLQLTLDEEDKLIKTIDDLNKENVNYIHDPRGYQKGETPIGPGEKVHTCGAFESLLSISPDGRLVPCLKGSANEEFYAENVLTDEKSLPRLWRESKLRKQFQNIELKGKCKNCEYNLQCTQGCPLETYILTGELGGYNPNCLYEPHKKER